METEIKFLNCKNSIERLEGKVKEKSPDQKEKGKREKLKDTDDQCRRDSTELIQFPNR